MKIIEAMKRLKHLNEKASDLREKASRYCSDLDFEGATYPDQKQQVSDWIQSHTDTVREIAKLRVAIQKTNIATPVTIEIDGQQVSKTIAEWIHRRKDLSKLDFAIWNVLGDRGLKEGGMQTSSGTVTQVKIRRYFDPKQRDERLNTYRQEPSLIDGTLEVVNAVTDLVE